MDASSEEDTQAKKVNKWKKLEYFDQILHTENKKVQDKKEEIAAVERTSKAIEICTKAAAKAAWGKTEKAKRERDEISANKRTSKVVEICTKAAEKPRREQEAARGKKEQAKRDEIGVLQRNLNAVEVCKKALSNKSAQKNQKPGKEKENWSESFLSIRSSCCRTFETQ